MFSLQPQELGAIVSDKQAQNVDSLGGAAGIAKKLDTDLKRGLGNKNLDKRRAHFGANQLPEVESQSFFSLVLDGLQDRTLIMLIVAALVSLALGIHEDPSTGWIEGFAIIMAVTLVVMVTATNDYQKERQFRALNSKKDDRAVKVIREGGIQEISVREVLVGDIMVVETGDILCADAIFVSGHGIKCDESSATGEADEIKKPEHDPFFLSGSQVLEGYGTVMIVAVGEHSFHGKTMLSLRVESEDTPLQQKLDQLADGIGKIGLIFACLTLFLLMAKYFITASGPFEMSHFLSHFVKILITAITMLVVAVPEGLPLAVTISLAYSMVKMLKDNNLVRHLAACETMGGATAVCSDKTGTLTQNKMTVVSGRVGDVAFDEVQGLKLPKAIQELFSQGVAVNTTAYEAEAPSGIDFLGNKTECALLGFNKKLGANYKMAREQNEAVELVPFSSARKSMATVIANREGGFRCHTKGAAEIVLERCTHRLAGAGDKPTPITEEERAELNALIKGMATRALRTLCLAYRDSSSVPAEGWDKFSQEGLTMIGIVGIQDPLREEVPGAVQACQRAGVVVRMVTGDNLVTAINIAKNCGIFVDDGSMLAMEGPQFRELSVDEFDEILPRLRVLARSSPLDKQILVDKLKEMGEVVAVTGDGTNDAPALKLAHVGFSMGIAGTEVAKEASDIILMDDNFSSIVKAMLWGRNVFDSIRKFLQFQLTVNIVAVILAFVGSLTSGSGESPLKPVQLLWVNLIMDTMAALALATEEPTPELLDRKPHSREAHGLITPTMWKSIIGQAIFQLIVNFGLLYLVPSYFGIEEGSVRHLTIFFNTFVMCQVFNEINARKINDELNVFRGFFSNTTFLGIMAFTLIMQYVLVQFGGEFTSTTPLTRDEWLFCIGIGALSLPVGFVLRLIPIRAPRASDQPAKKATGAGGSEAARARWKGAVSSIKKQNSVLLAFNSKKKSPNSEKLQSAFRKIRAQSSVISFLRKERLRGHPSKIQLMELEKATEGL